MLPAKLSNLSQILEVAAEQQVLPATQCCERPLQLGLSGNRVGCRDEWGTGQSGISGKYLCALLVGRRGDESARGCRALVRRLDVARGVERVAAADLGVGQADGVQCTLRVIADSLQAAARIGDRSQGRERHVALELHGPPTDHR